MSDTRLLRLAAALCGMLLVAACASPQGSVVLLPERDGRSTALTVSQGDASLTLQQPYAAAQLTSRGPKAFQADEQTVRARFAEALAAQPVAPKRFTLYFVEGSDELTDESKQLVDGILAEIARRPVPDVLVIGHTDKVGGDAFNDALSRRRADVVRAALLGRGLAAAQVQAIGRGKREPDVPAAEGVPEPRNRRVEIQVR